MTTVLKSELDPWLLLLLLPLLLLKLLKKTILYNFGLCTYPSNLSNADESFFIGEGSANVFLQPQSLKEPSSLAVARSVL